MTNDQQFEIQKKLLPHSSLKALQILSALSFYSDGSGINEISTLTQLPQSTVHRILQELMESGLVVKDKKTYKLGIFSQIFSEIFASRDFVVEAASEEMDRLNELTGETVHVIKLENYEAVYSARRVTKHQIGIRSFVGRHIPLYCTSGGKVILAYQNSLWLKEYLEKTELKKLTDTTITSPEDLKNELYNIRMQGYAIDRSEHNPEVVCCAAPIFMSNGKVTCTIGVATPKYRIDEEKLRLYTEETVKSADIITKKLRLQ